MTDNEARASCHDDAVLTEKARIEEQCQDTREIPGLTDLSGLRWYWFIRKSRLLIIVGVIILIAQAWLALTYLDIVFDRASLGLADDVNKVVVMALGFEAFFVLRLHVKLKKGAKDIPRYWLFTIAYDILVTVVAAIWFSVEAQLNPTVWLNVHHGGIRYPCELIVICIALVAFGIANNRYFKARESYF